jgi:hypothetical protein
MRSCCAVCLLADNEFQVRVDAIDEARWRSPSSRPR